MAERKFKFELNDLCVMAILAIHDSYGYEINQQLLEVLDVSESTLYPILRKLEKQGIVRSYSREHGGRLRRYCTLTPDGRRVFAEAAGQWRTLRDWIDAKLGEGLGHE